jgi:hypothetical protein
MKHDQLDEIISFVEEELVRARKEFPYWPTDLIHASAIVGEEAGELLQASLKHTYEKGLLENCDKEAIQCLAMCIRFLQRG